MSGALIAAVFGERIGPGTLQALIGNPPLSSVASTSSDGASTASAPVGAGAAPESSGAAGASQSSRRSSVQAAKAWALDRCRRRHGGVCPHEPGQPDG